MARSKKIMGAVGELLFDAGSKFAGLGMLFGAFFCLGLIKGLVEGVTGNQWDEFWFFLKPVLICLVIFILGLFSTLWGDTLEEKARKSDNR